MNLEIFKSMLISFAVIMCGSVGIASLMLWAENRNTVYLVPGLFLVLIATIACRVGYRRSQR